MKDGKKTRREMDRLVKEAQKPRTNTTFKRRIKVGARIR